MTEIIPETSADKPTVSPAEAVIFQKPRPAWVFGLAIGELAIIMAVSLVMGRLGVHVPPAFAHVVSIVAAAYLAYRVERRYPGAMGWRTRILLALEVSALLSVANGLAFYFKDGGVTISFVLLIAALGALLSTVVHLAGFQAGLSTLRFNQANAKLKRG